jgi:hypothetical protein
VYVIPGNILENGEAAYTKFELVVEVFNWTVTALTPWIKEDPSEQNHFNVFNVVT